MSIFQKGFSDFYHIPYWISALLWRNIVTHAYSEAPIAATQNAYPVILFFAWIIWFSQRNVCCNNRKSCK